MNLKHNFFVFLTLHCAVNVKEISNAHHHFLSGRGVIFVYHVVGVTIFKWWTIKLVYFTG